MKNEKGAALIVVIVVFMVMSIMGAALISRSVGENRIAVAQENQVKSYYTARSGADAMASYLIEDPSKLNDAILKTQSGPATGTIDDRTFEVYVTGTEHEFIIESIAYKDGQENARVYLTITEFDLMGHAIFANQILDTGNNVTVTGNIGTNQPSILFGNNDVIGNVTLGPGATPSDIENAENNITSGHYVSQLSTPIIFPPVDPSDFPVWLPSGTININTSGNLVDGKMTRALNRIDISGSTEFYVHGGGQVHLYISELINVSGTASIGTDADTELLLYYDNNDTITFNGTPNSKISIYAPDARINYNGGGTGETIVGSFVCDTFDGPDSNCTISQNTAFSMDDLLVDGVAGYTRTVWSK